jgi:hypothetical protein
LKRTIASSTAAVRQYATDLSAIVATLVIGSEVDELDTTTDWVKVATDVGRQGWMKTADLGPAAEAGAPPAVASSTPAPPPTLAAERTVLQQEMGSVEMAPLRELATQIEAIAKSRQRADYVAQLNSVRRLVLKNYAGYAFVALVLYSFLWLPGLIANIKFLNLANADQRADGKVPQGKGCLVWLLWVFGIIPVVTFVFLIVLGILVS